MKKLLYLLLLLGLSGFLFAGWEPVGPFGGPLNTVVIAPSNESVIYVAMATFTTDAPILMYRSIDGGVSWQKTTPPPMVSSLAVDPADPNTVYAGTGIGAVFKTTDGGFNWTYYPVTDAFMLFDIAVDPTNASTVYAVGTANSNGVKMAFFKSIDGGENWSTTVLFPGANGEARALALDPSNSSTLYVGGSAAAGPKVCKTTNGGNSFTDVTGNIDPTGGHVRCLAVNTSNSNIVYATTYYKGIHRTTSGGNSWTLVRTEDSLTALETTTAASEILYVGKDVLVLKSTDSGNTWFDAGTGYGGEALFDRGIAASQTNTAIVHTTCRQGFFTTNDSGSNWYKSNQGICMTRIMDIACAPSAAAVLYTATRVASKDGPIYYSSDSGSTWTMVTTPVSGGGVCGVTCALAVHNTDPTNVYALEGLG